MTIRQTLGNSKLSPLDAELILSFVLAKSREYLFAYPEKKLSAIQASKFNKLAKRRLRGEPVAHIIGKKEFFGLEFAVNRNVLIPRPETELLVEKSLSRIFNNRCQVPNSIIDVGTGSGSIIVSVVKNIPFMIRKNINFYGADFSKKALEIAEINAKIHKVSRHIKFVKSDLLKFFRRKIIKGNILVIANLPYVSEKLYSKYKKGLKYEPKTALVSERRGLAHYTQLLKQIKTLPDPCYRLSVTCFIEISPEQKKVITKTVLKCLPGAKIKFYKDLSGKDRVVEIYLK